MELGRQSSYHSGLGQRSGRSEAEMPSRLVQGETRGMGPCIPLWASYWPWATPREGHKLGQCSSLKPKVIPVRVTIINYQQLLFPEAETKAPWP